MLEHEVVIAWPFGIVFIFGELFVWSVVLNRVTSLFNFFEVWE